MFWPAHSVLCGATREVSVAFVLFRDLWCIYCEIQLNSFLPQDSDTDVMPIQWTSKIPSSVLAPFSSKFRQWEVTAHDGLVYSPKTQDLRAMFACQKCAYQNDRLYHAKMHHLRIHVLNGFAMPGKRKYTQTENVGPAAKTKTQIRAQVASDARDKLVNWRREVQDKQPEVTKNAKKQKQRTNSTKHQVMRFGAFNIERTQEPFTRKEMQRFYELPMPVEDVLPLAPESAKDDDMSYVPPFTWEDETDAIHGNLPFFCMDQCDATDYGMSLLVA